MTFTLEEFYKLYVRKIVRLHGVSVSIVSEWEIQVYGSCLEEFLASHGDTIDDKHNFSSLDERSVREDHPNFRGHATGMRPRSQG